MQSWQSDNWANADWSAVDWLAAASPALTENVAWVSTQRDQAAGGEGFWSHPDWTNDDWSNQQWLSGVGWRAFFTPAIVGGGYTQQFVIPALTIFPQYVFRTLTGFNGSLIGVQANQTSVLSSQFLLAGNRSASLIGLQAANTSSLRVTFTPSLTYRTATMAGRQAPQASTLTATLLVSGVAPRRFYGRVRP